MFKVKVGDGYTVIERPRPHLFQRLGQTKFGDLYLIIESLCSDILQSFCKRHVPDTSEITVSFVAYLVPGPRIETELRDDIQSIILSGIGLEGDILKPIAHTENRGADTILTVTNGLAPRSAFVVFTLIIAYLRLEIATGSENNTLETGMEEAFITDIFPGGGHIERGRAGSRTVGFILAPRTVTESTHAEILDA